MYLFFWFCCFFFFFIYYLLLLLKEIIVIIHGRARLRVAKVCYPEGQRILLAGVLEHGEPERQ